jgi:hypothetical protein
MNGVSRSDTMRVFGVMDLQQARWNAEWTCRGISIHTERISGQLKAVDSVRPDSSPVPTWPRTRPPSGARSASPSGGGKAKCR